MQLPRGWNASRAIEATGDSLNSCEQASGPPDLYKRHTALLWYRSLFLCVCNLRLYTTSIESVSPKLQQVMGSS